MHARSLAALLLAAPVGAQTTWYVDVDGVPPGTGTQNDPYTSLQYAIDQGTTLDGDVLLVLPGTYLEAIDLAGKTLSVVSTTGHPNTTIDGGASGVPTLRAASGEGAGTLVAGFTVTGGESWNDWGNQVHLSGSSLTLDDCRVTNAGEPLGAPVAGIYAENGDLELVGCIATANYDLFAQGFGGGALHVASGTVSVRDSSFDGNVGAPGGAVHVASGAVEIESCTFAHNGTFNDHAGALYVGGGFVTVVDSVFHDNSTHFDDYRGGAIFQDGGTLLIERTSFLDNLAAHGGAACVFPGANAAFFTDCEFRRNVARSNGFALDGRGGGLALGVLTTLKGCVFEGNRAEGGNVFSAEGGAWIGSGTAERCTLVDNVAADWFAGNQGGGARAGFLNSCIVWGNYPDQLSGATAVWSDVEGGYAGQGNLDADPLFVGYELPVPDLHLQPGSPCVDAGDPNISPDPDGSTADMGAYPLDVNHVPEPVPYCTAKVASPGCTPSIGWTGSPTLSGADDFVVTADQVPGGQLGLLFWGFAADEQPLFGGTLCIAPPLVRTSVTSSGGNPGGGDCSGQMTFAFTQGYAASKGLGAWDTVFAQWWFRDPGYAPPNNVGFTNGLAFVLAP